MQPVEVRRGILDQGVFRRVRTLKGEYATVRDRFSYLHREIDRLESLAARSMGDEEDDALFNELIRIKAAADVRVEGGSLVFNTGEVQINGEYPLGRFTVTVLNNGNVRVYELEGNRRDTTEGLYFHPHVDSGGHACLGTVEGKNLSDILLNLMENGKIGSVIFNVMSWIESYNPADPYVQMIKLIPSFEGDHCRSCSEEMPCGCRVCNRCGEFTHYQQMMGCNCCEYCCGDHHVKCVSCDTCFTGGRCPGELCADCCRRDHNTCEGCLNHLTNQVRGCSTNYCDTCCRNTHNSCSSCNVCAYRDSVTEDGLIYCVSCLDDEDDDPFEEDDNLFAGILEGNDGVRDETSNEAAGVRSAA